MPKLALIVDDNRALAEDLGELLEHEGYQIQIFDDPLEALQAASALAFDVALLDVRMPGLDGVSLQRKLAQEHPHARYVLMTAFADDKRLAQALEAGVSAVLTKPVPVAALFAALGDQGSRELLLVEDDASFREALSDVLCEGGYRCHAVGSAAEARAFVAQRSASGEPLAFGVIDVGLPDCNGAQLALDLGISAGLPCILITGWEPDLAAPRVDGQLILVKPFPPDALLRTLSRLRGATS